MKQNSVKFGPTCSPTIPNDPRGAGGFFDTPVRGVLLQPGGGGGAMDYSKVYSEKPI